MARFDKFTLKSQEAVQAAQDMAGKRHHQQMEPEHLLMALLDQQEGVIVPVLKKLGADPGRIRAEVEEALNRVPKVEGLVQTYLSPRLGKLFERAEQEAERLKDEYISTELLLVGAVEGDGAARDILKQQGQVPGPYQVREGPYGFRPARQARPGDRQGRGDQTRRAGAVAAHQEQSRADRRAGRG
jgi:ATP-dependent Clp protease ATP-binding subunit ClpB